MQRKIFLCLLVLAMLVFSVFPASCAEQADYALYAVTTGKADALLLKVQDHAFLIDTGYARARGRILYGMQLLGIDRLDGVFITHTDNDHTDGLEWLAQSDIPVEHWYASAMYIDVKEGKHPAEKAAALRGRQVEWLRAGDSIEAGDAVLQVLAPGTLFQDKDDNNSLVMKLRTPLGSMLLCGDMEYPQQDWLMRSGADLKCDVLKVPNHGDDDVCSQAFLNAASPSVAVISTDSQEKPDTPDPALMARLASVCPAVLQTQDAGGGVLVQLTKDGVRTDMITLPQACRDVVIADVNSNKDFIVLQNKGTETVDLAGWYLVPDKKNAMIVLPQDASIAPGETVTIGGKASGADYISGEKRLINKKKADGATLYDDFGNEISHKTNGK